MSQSASRGSVGGSSDDAGVEYRRGVAAYLAACGLAGAPVQGLAIHDVDAHPISVALETDEPVDDVRVEFSTGWTADIQAKRTVTKGRPLEQALEQWSRAGLLELDPTRHRLVIVAGHLSEPVRQLRIALDRRRLSTSGRKTRAEADILAYVGARLSKLTDAQRERVLDAGVIWHLAVEEPHQAGAREATGLLREAGFPGAVWPKLTSVAGDLARARGGHDLAGWAGALRGVGLVSKGASSTPAATIERSRVVLSAYAERLVRESREIDLRSLGADLPPAVIDEADAVVHVSSNPDDTRSHAELLWSFLRRGRVVLTGLPGSGKSTAVRRAAGRLAYDWKTEHDTRSPGSAGLPMPVRVSLRDVNALGTVDSFRDRVVRLAVRDNPVDHREILRREIEQRLDEGRPIAIFLDALDETYADRGRVVRELEEFLAGIPDSALVLVATRDIAYAQAATLGWADLRLRKPEAGMKLVGAVLEVAARHRRVEADQVADWVGLRRGWVSAVLSRDRDLAETPLIPLLLAVLAAEQEMNGLPTRRAQVLKAVVQSVVGRHEIRRSDDRPIGPLQGEGRGDAALAAFAAEAAVILDNSGVAPLSAVRVAVRNVLAAEWALSPGHARAAATAVVRFLDETGVFVVDEAARTVSARISIFAEIGDAMSGVHKLGGIESWVGTRLDQRQLEPVMLAAELDAGSRAAVTEQFRQRPDDIELSRALNRSHRNASWLDEPTVNLLRTRFIDSIARGTAEGWSDWRRLMALGVPIELVSDAVAAAAKHTPQHQLLARVDCGLAEGPTALTLAVEDLVELMEVTHIAKSPSESKRQSAIWDLGIDRGLAEVQVAAARSLITREHPRAVDLIEKRATGAAGILGDPLRELLREFGHADAANRSEQDDRQQVSDTMSRFLRDENGSKYPDFLRLLAQWPTAPLTTAQKVGLAELGEFAETLNLNDIGVRVFYGKPDWHQLETAALIADLFDFDRGVLAAQAGVLLARLEIDDALDTYFAIFDTSRGRTEVDWSRVEDPSRASEVLLELFAMAPAHARLAAICMWGSHTMESFVVDELRERTVLYSDHEQHQRWVALTLVSFPSTPEPRPWLQSDDPLLRSVAAETVVALVDGKASPELQSLLLDPDGTVRHQAVQRLGASHATDTRKLLVELLESDPVEWTCRHCRSVNKPHWSSCHKDHFVGGDPVAAAKKLLGGAS